MYNTKPFLISGAKRDLGCVTGYQVIRVIRIFAKTSRVFHCIEKMDIRSRPHTWR